MAIWGDHLLPRLINCACNTKAGREIRERVCADLSGDVLELGSGSGLNAPHYPGSVSGVWTIEPSAVARTIATKRYAATEVPIQYAGPDAQRMELPDSRFDVVLSTWTMCTIPDLEAALAESYRVLKPGGALRFVEHGRSPDAKVARMQDRLEPLHSRILGGCKVTREFPLSVEKAGFTVTTAEHFYEKGAPKYTGFMTVGSAVKPG
ncbi:MAG: hypothetical protein QOG53_2673 [Frankiales bacterium]|jgi:ubiquinone/menaquinone biosynthesis C-methylase UbiE|nr:hypothetical protein [Frankiales bacterium]